MGVLLFILAVIVIYGLYYAGAKLFIVPKKVEQPRTPINFSKDFLDRERYIHLSAKQRNGKLSPEEQSELNGLKLRLGGRGNPTQKEQYEEWLISEAQKEKEWFDNTQL